MKEFLLAFIPLFVALDIIGTLPIYAGMTHAMARSERIRILNVSMLVALVTALAFLFGGLAIFKFLGITVGDFKIAGGIVLLLISLADLVGASEAEKRTSGQTGVVPLAVPLITGPGVLTTLILLRQSPGLVPTIAALIVNYFAAWILLLKSDTVTRILGKDGTVVISKIAALLLAAISVAMVRSGLVELFPVLGGPSSAH